MGPVRMPFPTDSLFLDSVDNRNYWAATSDFSLQFQPRSTIEQDRIGKFALVVDP